MKSTINQKVRIMHIALLIVLILLVTLTILQLYRSKQKNVSLTVSNTLITPNTSQAVLPQKENITLTQTKEVLVEDSNPLPKQRLKDLLPLVDDCGIIDLTIEKPTDFTNYNCYCEKLFDCGKVKGDFIVEENAHITFELNGIQSDGLCQVQIISEGSDSYLTEKGDMTCKGPVYPDAAPSDEVCKEILGYFIVGFVDAARDESDLRCVGSLRNALVQS